MHWLWLLVIGLPPMIESGVFDSFAPPAPVAPVVQPSESVNESPVVLLFIGIVTLLFLALTLFILVKLPKNISHTGEKIVQQTTAVALPIITHHKKIPPNKQRVLSRRISRGIQVSLIIIPLLISLFLPGIDQITPQIIVTLSCWLAATSLVCLLLSWLIQPSPISQTRSRVSRG